MPTSFLTKDGYFKLQKELDELRNVKRKEVAARLHEAMEDGELIENAEYEAAKNEQAFVEGRISELKMILANAQIIDDDDTKNNGTIQVGSTVYFREIGENRSTKYMIVGAAEANPAEGKISNESPIGKALIGHAAGDELDVEAPGGSFKIRITTVK
jgi:transcription elongation factor GreA